MVTSAPPGAAEALIRFIDRSPSPFHAVAEAAHLLDAAGFTAVDGAGTWPAGGRHYLVRDGSLVAWAVPDGAPAATPFRLVGAHTDSPNLRIKPRPDTGRAGWRQLGVEVYGGALLNSWLDRDLGLSGRVALRSGETRLVLVDRPVLRVPQLAIHLDRNVNDGGLVLNKQVHMTPVWGLGQPSRDGFAGFLADELDVPTGDVVAWDVMVHDVTPGALIGVDQELIASGRLDNLCSSWAGVVALADVASTGAAQTHVPVVCLFDHEEVGSTTATGAAGELLPHVLERIVLARGGGRDDYLRSLAGSACASADMAHATHPNYSERHDPEHPIACNAGPVIKVNANARYATDAAGAALFERACDAAGVPVQRFVSRSDMPCGSTIGPLTAGRLGIPTVDVGVAQLGMHSAREVCGAADPAMFTASLAAFLRAA
jgi:aspartyl aminopeptidase